MNSKEEIIKTKEHLKEVIINCIDNEVDAALFIAKSGKTRQFFSSIDGTEEEIKNMILSLWINFPDTIEIFADVFQITCGAEIDIEAVKKSLEKIKKICIGNIKNESN